MMHRDIHRPESPHGQATDCSVRGISQCPVVPVDVSDEIDSNEGFHELAPIEAIAPFTRFAWSPIAIGQD